METIEKYDGRRIKIRIREFLNGKNYLEGLERKEKNAFVRSVNSQIRNNNRSWYEVNHFKNSMEPIVKRVFDRYFELDDLDKIIAALQDSIVMVNTKKMKKIEAEEKRKEMERAEGAQGAQGV